MRKTMLCLLLATLLSLCVAAQDTPTGVPFFRNYAATDYQGNNRNSDILTDTQGRIYVANFEGVLCYDQATWRMEHLNSLTRPTALTLDEQGTLWVDGYHYYGRTVIAPNGSFALQRLQKADRQQEADKHDTLTIEGGMKAVATMGRGLLLYDAEGRLVYNVSEENGLCSNNVNRLAYNGHGTLWGATENGIFAMMVPSPYSCFRPSEGLHGEVYSMRRFAGKMYVGTTSGLYRQQGQRFEHVSGVNHLCWDMQEVGGRLLIATEGGLYALQQGGSASQLNGNPTRTLLVDVGGFYTGEDAGVYLNRPSGTRTTVSTQHDVMRIVKDYEGRIWLQTLYGEIWHRQQNQSSFERYTKTINVDDDQSLLKATLVVMDGQVTVVDAIDTEPFPYPQFSQSDATGLTWLTNAEGEQLYVWNGGQRDPSYDALLYPLREKAIRCLWDDGRYLWMGGEQGVIILDRQAQQYASRLTSNLRICSVTLNGDSVLWGGFGQQPETLRELGSNENNLYFTFALDFPIVLGEAQYQYRMDDNEWSKPSLLTHAQFNNQGSGRHTFQVRAIDAAGHMGEPVSMHFTIRAPFYMRWYMQLLYLLALAVVVFLLVRWRIRTLEKDKQRLESVVEERTANLKTALNELGQAQNELIRQEKMATVGKLTQGLIDRILNPLNYINNFSKLSQGLVKDVEANIDDEKDNMSEENYEDTMDVLGMLKGNLEKVSEHGENTTRTLKAMEEMLKDRTGGIVDMDLSVVLRQDEEMLKTYYVKEIADEHINVVFDFPADAISIKGNADQLSKTLMSLLGNAVYAVVKKAQRERYSPEITLRATDAEDKVTISIRDNGIGIEDTIIGKIFDPFFTTKTTGEAAGVGLYLSREIVQNHGGDISVASVKNEYTEFTIVIPKKR
ncbi:MAG: GHKL domain-containing protein [Prevotella sp.]|nr:GHKL domain-containing protein [Prevotella sp.]